jgi:hypothetical protein
MEQTRRNNNHEGTKKEGERERRMVLQGVEGEKP